MLERWVTTWLRLFSAHSRAGWAAADKEAPVAAALATSRGENRITLATADRRPHAKPSNCKEGAVVVLHLSALARPVDAQRRAVGTAAVLLAVKER